jgi:dsRNA-specific ribonuclease
MTSEPSSTPHNSRLSFLGRRAIASYLALFVHEAIGTSTQLKDMDFLRGKTLEEKLEALRHVNNLGREVGERWGIDSVMRWDRNHVSQSFTLLASELTKKTGTESGHAKIKGMAVESVFGGIFTQFGSPAAHRAFHTILLPYLSSQFRDQALKEKIEMMRKSTEKEFSGSVLLP